MAKHLKIMTFTYLLLLLCRSGHAYELQSHRVMSLNAARASVLGTDTKMQQLGLLPIAWPTQRFLSSPSTDTVTRQCIHGTAMTVWDLIGCGAQFEDVPSNRSFNHFYDPWNDMPLTIPVFGQMGSRSPDWALEDRGAINGQDNSYGDARKSFVEALTTTNNTSRAAAWGRTFQSLGQVIHHLQDMGQPQHVRNDDHCDNEFICRLLLAYKPSRYERYATQRNSVITSVSGTADGYSIYPTLQKSLLLPRDFWMAPNGIAGYTNQHYVSAGTNFTVLRGGSAPGSVYPLPLPDDSKSETVPVQAAYSALRKPIPDSIADFCKNNDCNLTLVPTRDGLPRAATLSIFDQDLTTDRAKVTLFNDFTGANFQVDRVYSLNALNFDAAFPDLITRATAYSAGLLNYFFRGQLSIELPAAGVYGIGDLSTAQGCLADCGFRSLRLKVTNVTPGKEAIGKGKLWAVAKFHRNNCFTLDRSGQYGAEGNDWVGRRCRDEVENIAISAPITITAGIAITPTEYTFNFSTSQIPFSATDLYLQAVFQGDLGAESGNAVAVGTSDIMEPTFWSVDNHMDYRIRFKTTECNIGDAAVTNVGGVGTANNMGFGLRFENAASDQVTGTVANGEHAVVAYLTSNPRISWHFHDNIDWSSDEVQSASRDQMEVETGVLLPSLYVRRRNGFEGGATDFGLSFTGAVFADDNCPWSDDAVFSIINDLPASGAPMKSVTVNLSGVDSVAPAPDAELRPRDQRPRAKSSQHRAVNAPQPGSGGN